MEKKSNLLRSVSIIMVILGAFYTLVGVLNFFMGIVTSVSTNMVSLLLMNVLMVAYGAMLFWSGITGVKGSTHTIELKTCKKTGYLLLAIAAVCNGSTLAYNPSISAIVNLAIGIGLPLFYLYGVRKVN